MSFARRDIVGGAPRATLSGNLNSGDTTISISSGTGWPTGANGNFYISIDRGNAAEEKILCSTRVGTSLSVAGGAAGRGADGTAAAAHTSGVYVEHVITAVDADEANYTATKTVGKVTTAGDLLVADGANSLVRLGNGTTGFPLVAGASSPAYAQLGSSGIADDAITGAKIVADAVGPSEIATSAVGTTELADAGVTEAKLAASVAGSGLAGGAGTALSVGVDGSTIEINADAIRVKDGGITNAKAASGLSFTNIATSAPAGATGQLWFDSDDNLLYVQNSSGAWVCITPQSATVATVETTASSSYTNLSTSGAAQSAQTGTKALVTVGAQLSNGNAAAAAVASFAISGATTAAASDVNAVWSSSSVASNVDQQSYVSLVTGLTPGVNTFTMKYKASNGGTASFSNRSITVVGLP